MKFETKVMEVKTTFSTEKGSSSNKHGCILTENTNTKLSNGRMVSIPKGNTIHNGALIGYQEYSNRIYINDLTNSPGNEEVTLKLEVKIPILPKCIPNFIVEGLTKVSLIPYFSCDCWSGDNPKTVSIYGKERFERFDEEINSYKSFLMKSIPDGKFKKIRPFCPYYLKCKSDFPEQVFINNKGEEKTQFDLDMAAIEELTKSKRS